ncbi:hypothetical protein P153DRAFT_279212 [Dothidotthia symphoricarpi CBS 119687]|uniref:Uncharacterized protein n=1 Tax=Dothidotthia symphoricarpi CBS 119687 TaxID=1392245 RepID=A0A6A6AUE0_9PLEO|nr:uncharacterized protein P153DRAFT_279212 [Dothidotthia symphoricarpi CBS 119687]KAF2134833.1 hypothetical protein P153DRAFT_279212 [Dothidotthia symphoricarpi CBS 119687]
MAFRQQQRPQSSRQISLPAPEPVTEAATSSQHLKRPLDASEEWVLFSPAAPSTTARTQTTTTERTAGLSRFSEFGSLDTAARSDQHGNDGTFLDTEEEELDSLDDGLRAFHEPSESGAPASRLQESNQTVLPTHDGLGTFQPDATMEENIWQFERHLPRRRLGRRRSSLQRHFTTLDETEEVNQEQERRQRIERWRLEQSKALLEEVEKQTRRRRRMSIVGAARSRANITQPDTRNAALPAAQAVLDAQSESLDESTEHMSIWQRITRRVIRDLIGLDEDTLSVIFGETLPEEALTPKSGLPAGSSVDSGLPKPQQDLVVFSDNMWQTRLLERVAQELGVLVHQLSEHPGAFSTYQRTQTIPTYAAFTTTPTLATEVASSRPTDAQTPAPSPPSAQFAPTFPARQTSHVYSDASLWGIEEEPEPNTVESFHAPPTSSTNIAEDLAREREYWERDLDINMIFSFLLSRFRGSTGSSPPRRSSSASASAVGTDVGESSARRAAFIRHNHPLVNRTTGSGLPTSSSSSNIRETRRKDATYRTYFNPQSSLRHQKLRSNSSCASQSTKKSKRSAGSNRNFWDLGGSVGSGSIFAGEV